MAVEQKATDAARDARPLRQRGTRARLTAAERAVQGALRRRGLDWRGERDPTPLLLPRRAGVARHYALLRHYSYRLFLRDVITRRDRMRLDDLTRYASREVAARYLAFLVRAGLVGRVARGAWRLRLRGVRSFGGTLEWYVARVLGCEFGCAAAHGLRIPRALHGGDYDVVACTEGDVIYVETKSAPPRQILESELGAFLDRVDTLRPDVALFLADTQLRMRDKLVPLFTAEAARRRLGWEAARLEREIWRIGPEIYLLNSDPDLVRNVGACLAAHFRGRGIRVAARTIDG